jgi:peptidoglycan/LPS O-acetylase OafA/YrhL
MLVDRSGVGAAESAAAWLMNALLVHIYVPAASVQSMYNNPSWSIACEAVFYACFPFLVGFIARRARTARALVGLAIAFWAIEALLFVLPLAVMVRSGGDVVMRVDYGPYRFPLCRIWEFAIGCCLGILHLRHRPAALRRAGVRNAGLIAAAVGAVLAMAASRVLPQGEFLAWYVLFTPVFALAILCMASGRTVLDGVLAHRSVVLLGEASYALYLWHWMALLLVRRLFGEAVPGWAAWAAVAACVPVSLATFAWVETPARRWLRSRLGGPAEVRRRVSG